MPEKQASAYNKGSRPEPFEAVLCSFLLVLSSSSWSGWLLGAPDRQQAGSSELDLWWRKEDSAVPRSSRGIMDEMERYELSSFSSSDDDDEAAAPSTTSSSSDFTEDGATPSPPNAGAEEEGMSFFDMSNLFDQIPIKRGLSKHFQGKSQSFSSLSKVQSLKDLAKPERPWRKKLKPSKSYGGGLDCQKALSFSKPITKRPLRSSFSSLGSRRQSFGGGSRPPIAPQRSSGHLGQ